MTDGAGDPSRFNRPSRDAPQISSARVRGPALSRRNAGNQPFRTSVSRVCVCVRTNVENARCVRPARFSLSLPRCVSLTCTRRRCISLSLSSSFRSVRSNCCIPVACEAPFFSSLSPSFSFSAERAFIFSLGSPVSLAHIISSSSHLLSPLSPPPPERVSTFSSARYSKRRYTRCNTRMGRSERVLLPSRRI